MVDFVPNIVLNTHHNRRVNIFCPSVIRLVCRRCSIIISFCTLCLAMTMTEGWGWARDTGTGTSLGSRSCCAMVRYAGWRGTFTAGARSTPDGFGRARLPQRGGGGRTNETELAQCCIQQRPGGSDEVRVRLSWCGVASVASSRSLEEWYLPERSRRQSSGSRSCSSSVKVL